MKKVRMSRKKNTPKNNIIDFRAYRQYKIVVNLIVGTPVKVKKKPIAIDS